MRFSWLVLSPPVAACPPPILEAVSAFPLPACLPVCGLTFYRFTSSLNDRGNFIGPYTTDPRFYRTLQPRLKFSRSPVPRTQRIVVGKVLVAAAMYQSGFNLLPLGCSWSCRGWDFLLLLSPTLVFALSVCTCFLTTPQPSPLFGHFLAWFDESLICESLRVDAGVASLPLGPFLPPPRSPLSLASRRFQPVFSLSVCIQTVPTFLFFGPDGPKLPSSPDQA